MNNIEIAAGSTVRSCSDSNIAREIVSAFSLCHDGNCQSQTFSCDGNEWKVGICGDAEIKVGSGGTCSCGNADIIIRPCVSNGNWGGEGGGCGQDTYLRITVWI